MANFKRETNDQAAGAISVTKSDSTVLDLTGGLYIGTGGDVAVTMGNGGVFTFKNVANGTFLPIQVIKVMSTNTTASDIIALY